MNEMKNLLKFSLLLTAVYFYGSSEASIRGIPNSQRKSSDDAPTLWTTSGQLRGLHVVKSKRVETYQYLGVPYAEPPVGPLRFQRPQPLNQSNALKDATQFAPTCIQMRHIPQFINPLLNVDEEHKISEDCLYLNVYIPKQLSTEEQKSLPIMVWLPGEGYDFADARQFDGQYLASLGKVIVITVQYRVGVFGFLKSDSISSGNMGLWDQIMALKWIKKNARAIGGDADNITVFGRFTGSMSISILLTSPVLRDMNPPLFKRAILLSGVAVGKWVFDHNYQKRANQLMTDIGCEHQSKDCLNGKPSQTILDKSSYFWKPTFDSELITEEPLNALKNGNFANGVTDVMLGTNKVEGSLCLLAHMAFKSSFYEKINADQLTENDFLELVEGDLKMFFDQSEDDSDSYQRKVFISSLIDRNQSSSFRDKYLEFCSSLFITSHMKNFNKLILERQFTKQRDSNITLTNTFMYELHSRPSFSISPQFIESAAHGDDVLLAFGLIHSSSVTYNQNDEKLTEMLIRSFSNFATYGNPRGLNPMVDNLWTNRDISIINANIESQKPDKDVVTVTQLFLFSSTAELLIAFLTTSTTILALLSTALICFIIFSLHRQRHSTEHRKDSPLL